MTKKKNEEGQYTSVVLNNSIDDVVDFQECMLKGLIETKAGWDDPQEFSVMKKYNEDVLAILKMVQANAAKDSNNIEYMPLGFRTDDIN